MEEWRPCLGFEGLYEASSLGRIRSLTHTNVNVNGVKKVYQGRVLRPKLAAEKRNYWSVNFSHDGIVTTQSVARLVARAFHGLPPAGHEVRHLNGDSLDNRAVNLKYGTHSENVFDTVAHGRHWASIHVGPGRKLVRTSAHANQEK